MYKRENGHRVIADSISLVIILFLLIGGSGCGARSPRPVATVTPINATSLASTATQVPTSSDAVATDVPATPTPTLTPLPTPTPIPLPQVCLRSSFAQDVANCGAIPRYDIALTVDLDAARVTGSQEIQYTNLETEVLDTLYLRLFPNAPGYGGTMTVTNVRLAGEPVAPIFELEDTAMRLRLTPPLGVGQAVTLSMDFDVGVPTTGRAGHALFAYLRGVMALPTVYPIIPVYDDEGWNVEIAPEYADDVYSDIAAYDVQITAPSGQTLVVTGACGPPMTGGDLATWHCQAGPMRDFVLILSDRYRFANRLVDGVVINSFYYEEHAQGGGKAVQVAADALATFNELFGPYPYSELDVVETPNHLGGMEYPGLVVVEDRLYAGVSGVEWLTAHEVAHQWWFGVVGSDPIDEPWLDEALTQYSTMLYYEKVYGEQRGAGIVNGVFVQAHQSLVRQGRDIYAGLPASAYDPALYWEAVYDKGALYFHYLRQTVGDEQFFEILRTYYDRHRYQIATPASFLAIVEDVTGDRHKDIYHQWILIPAP